MSIDLQSVFSDRPAYPLPSVLRAVFIGVILCEIGCGAVELKPGEPPPHDGSLVLLRDDRGVVEIVKKSGASPISAEVSFYFYKHPKENGGEPYAPWDSMPEAGVLIMGQKKVNLEVKDDALVTPSGALLFANKEVDGQLSIKVNGDELIIPLEVR
jgi:hypothetical protein